MATQKVANPRKTSLQVRHKKAEQDVAPFATKFSCATHQVTYYVPANRRDETCPVCSLEGEAEYLRDLCQKYENQIDMLRRTNEKMQVEVDITSAMKSAVEMLDDADKFWLKEQLYQFKLDKSVVLKVTHGAPVGQRSRRRDAKTPNGFIAVKRKGDPEGHTCSSIGGLALARYYEQATTTYGASASMDLMVKALWQFLPGARP